MNTNSDYPKRICSTTGLPICRSAEFFVKANAVLGVVFLLVGGIAAILIALTRWQAVHLLPVDWFYRILTLHGINMLIFWILFFEVAILYFVSTTLLKVRLASRLTAWISLVMMLVGAVMVSVRVTGSADSQAASPSCSARITTSPAAVAVSAVPAMPAGPLTTSNRTGRPELAVALRATAPAESDWLAGGGNAMVCWAKITGATAPAAYLM